MQTPILECFWLPDAGKNSLGRWNMEEKVSLAHLAILDPIAKTVLRFGI